MLCNKDLYQNMVHIHDIFHPDMKKNYIHIQSQHLQEEMGKRIHMSLLEDSISDYRRHSRIHLQGLLLLGRTLIRHICKHLCLIHLGSLNCNQIHNLNKLFRDRCLDHKNIKCNVIFYLSILSNFHQSIMKNYMFTLRKDL